MPHHNGCHVGERIAPQALDFKDKRYVALFSAALDLLSGGNRQSAGAEFAAADRIDPTRGEARAASIELTPTPVPPTATRVPLTATPVRRPANVPASNGAAPTGSGQSQLDKTAIVMDQLGQLKNYDDAIWSDYQSMLRQPALPGSSQLLSLEQRATQCSQRAIYIHDVVAIGQPLLQSNATIIQGQCDRMFHSIDDIYQAR